MGLAHRKRAACMLRIGSTPGPKPRMADQTKRPHGQLEERAWAYWFIAPTTLTIFSVFVYPLGVALWTSLHYDVMIRPELYRFNGLENYRAMLSEPRFWSALETTAFFFLTTVAITMLLGFAVALRLDRNLGRLNWIKPLFLVPMVVTPIVVGIQWKFMLNSQMGVITYFARLLGLPVSAWLTEPRGALFWVVAVDVWYYTPIVILLFSAGLSAIPSEVKEAADVDGASEWQTIRYVTLPMLKSIAITALLIRTIGGLRTFDTILVLTDGGPGRVTEVVNLYAYRMGFHYFDMGKAAALGWLMLGVALVLVVIYIRLLRATAESPRYV